MTDASDDHSTAKSWALISGIASVLSILGRLGLGNAAELKDLLTGPPSSSSGPAPYTPPPTADTTDDPGGNNDPGPGVDEGNTAAVNQPPALLGASRGAGTHRPSSPW
ncbi:hypothetical protein ACFUAC_04715 [Streptomyces sp. NPDC057148]|uniref:hypothetical protein n=1 Tax=unclassified Streptomyces TaxID=2593676 RepID=UPI00362FBC4F